MKATKEDSALAHKLVSEYGSRDDVGRLRHEIARALTTIRQEERRAVWDAAIMLIKDRFGGAANTRVVDVVATLQDAYAEAATPSPASSPVPPEQIVKDWEPRINEMVEELMAATPTPVEQEQLREVDERVNAGVARMDASEKVDATTMRIEFGSVREAAALTAKEVVNELLNVPRFIRNPESTIIELENKVAEIITRHCPPVSAAGGDEDNELKRKATQYFRWAYQLLLALAKRRLADANMENQAKGEPDNWPAGQAWHEMNGTSHSIFLRRAREEASIPEEAFMGVIRSLEVDVDDLYESAALGTSVGEEGK